MADAQADVPVWRVILVPAVATLAVTLFRVYGELHDWPSFLFGRAPGGGLALVGIVWLVPVFGVLFARRLLRGPVDVPALRVLGGAGLALLAIAVFTALIGAIKGEQTSLGILGVFGVASVLGTFVGMRAWPELGRLLFAYALSARIPVAILMLIAMQGQWETHYDLVPPGFPYLRVPGRWFWLALVPQMTIWVAFTVIVGTLAGGIALLAFERRADPGALARLVRSALPTTGARPAPAAARPAAQSLVRPAPLRPGAAPRPGAPPSAAPRPTAGPDRSIAPGRAIAPADRSMAPGRPVAPADRSIAPGRPVAPGDRSIAPGRPGSPLVQPAPPRPGAGLRQPSASPAPARPAGAPGRPVAPPERPMAPGRAAPPARPPAPPGSPLVQPAPPRPGGLRSPSPAGVPPPARPGAPAPRPAAPAPPAARPAVPAPPDRPAPPPAPGGARPAAPPEPPDPRLRRPRS